MKKKSIILKALRGEMWQVLHAFPVDSGGCCIIGEDGLAVWDPSHDTAIVNMSFYLHKPTGKRLISTLCEVSECKPNDVVVTAWDRLLPEIGKTANDAMLACELVLLPTPHDPERVNKLDYATYCHVTHVAQAGLVEAPTGEAVIFMRLPGDQLYGLYTKSGGRYLITRDCFPGDNSSKNIEVVCQLPWDKPTCLIDPCYIPEDMELGVELPALKGHYLHKVLDGPNLLAYYIAPEKWA